MNIGFITGISIIFIFGIGLFIYGLVIAKKLRNQPIQQTYDIKCEECGQQLDFYECKDRDGDKVIFISPHSCQSGTDWE